MNHGRRVVWILEAGEDTTRKSSVCTVELNPGQRATPAHFHPNAEECVYIVTGTGKVLIGEEIYEIEPGALTIFPPNVPHMLWNTGDTPMKGICFYSGDGTSVVYESRDDVDFPEFLTLCTQSN